MARMNYLVIGAGMMGRAIAYDLARHDSEAGIRLADVNLSLATTVAERIGGRVTPAALDARDPDDLSRSLHDTDVVISAAPYSFNSNITHAAISAGAHMCDLGGNNDVVRQQLALDGEARRAGVTIIPNCGLAPGLVNILAMHGVHQFDNVDSVSLRVGGLPKNPRPPLNYQLVFSVEGLVNEYLEKAHIIREGELQTVDSLSGLETIEFPAPFGTMEAFITSGGVSLLPELLKGQVRSLDYKTVRYPGHCGKFKTLLDLGFASSEPIVAGGTIRTAREFFEELLRRKLPNEGEDVVLARATIEGTRAGTAASLAYECVDYYDEATLMTAMMRMTAYPTSVIAQMLAHGIIADRGVLTPEQCVHGAGLLEALRARNIIITERWS